MHARPLKVARIIDETSRVKRLVLKIEDEATPTWKAGAHIRVQLPGGGDRAYSLLRLPGLNADEIALGVLLEPESEGGSRYMHRLQIGDTVRVTGPANNFTLADHAKPALLIAGGIGITPILSMAAELKAAKRPFSAIYAGQSRNSMAFLSEMHAICQDRLTLHFDDDSGLMDIQTLVKTAVPGTHLYICGPSAMIDAAKDAASHWDPARVHYELFSNEIDTGGDTAFDVEVHDTGQIVRVPADMTIIEALEDAGLDPLYDCQRGDCGICQVDVIDGIPDHRDIILSDAEKASNSVMQICVSRAKTPKLVLDL